MRTIGSIRTVVEAKTHGMVDRIAGAQAGFTNDLKNEIVRNITIPPASEALNPGQFMAYRDSLRTRGPEVSGKVITTEVYSDYAVYWQKKGIVVPVGVFLEWGTGPLGQDTNVYDHGYPYTTDAPWNRHAMRQFIATGTWGIQARPHWGPAIMKYRDRLLQEIESRL